MSGIVSYAFADAPAPMRGAAVPFEQRFGIDFDRLVHFSRETLSALHLRGDDEGALMAHVQVASSTNAEVVEAMSVLTAVANAGDPGAGARLAYFEALQGIYRAVAAPACGGGEVVIAPEREGRILAQTLGWLRPGRDLAPHAKRIPHAHGLLVGVSAGRLPRGVRKLVFVDGAIASGATLIALLDLHAMPGVPVEIYSVHAACEGLRAILRYAEGRGLEVRVHAGHVTEGLSRKFYAVTPGDGRLVVGDLGDTIAPVAATVALT